MATCKEWLAEKFSEWEKNQGRKQSYYAFARFLGVSQTDLARWMDGTTIPSGTDLHTLAARLGMEVYDSLGMPRPNPQFERLTATLPLLPAGLRERLIGAVWEAGQYVQSHNLSPESVEAKKAVVEIFARNGIKLTN
jgi:transcriptional regulator with XRE-family HTH domain